MLMAEWKTGRFGMRKGERGLRPLRAVGSLYEPEAVRAIGAYSPTRRARVYEPEAAPEGRGEKG
jgi:hypothetical protein